MKFYLSFAVLALVSSISIDKKTALVSEAQNKKDTLPVWKLKSVLDHRNDQNNINAYMNHSTKSADGRPPLRSNGKEFAPLKPLGWKEELKKKKEAAERKKRANKYGKPKTVDPAKKEEKKDGKKEDKKEAKGDAKDAAAEPAKDAAAEPAKDAAAEPAKEGAAEPAKEAATEPNKDAAAAAAKEDAE